MDQNTVHFDEQSRRIQSSDDDTGEGWMIRLCQEHAINMETMLEIVAEVENHFGEKVGGAAMGEGSSQMGTGGPGGSNFELRMAAASAPSAAGVFAMFKRTLRLVRCSRGVREVSDKLAYLFLAFGWHDELDGVDNSTDLARVLKVTKANSNKYVNLFRDVAPPGMKVIPPMGGQRQEWSRAKFTLIRHEQQLEKAGGSLTTDEHG